MDPIWAKQIRVFADQLNHHEEDEEALSLSDLPLIQKTEIESRNDDDDDDFPLMEAEIEEEFDFCSLAKESQMCAADEVFFQGQILPLRHSVSSEKGSRIGSVVSSNLTRPVSRSESMDRFYSGRLITSRSSSTSSGTSSSNISNPPVHKFKPRFNQFHSHPSPSPRIRFSTNKSGSIPPGRRSFGNSSSIWNVFKLGLVSAPPEIAFQDLKSRSSGNIKSGSRNSSSSTGSSVSITSSRRRSRTAAALFGAGGCRCSSSDAVPAVPARVVTIKRSASEGGYRREPERTVGRKKQLSPHHYYRTFEWIKQLSLEDETAS